VLIVGPHVTAKNLKDLIALAKAQPRQAELRLGGHRLGEPSQR
jgi:hypothetical protein